MSHEVVFLPHMLGQTWAEAVSRARVAAREEDPRVVAARLEPWPRLVLHAAEILGQIEEFRGWGQRELVHPVTRLRFTFFGEDGVIALPYWYDGPVARMAGTMAYRFAGAVEQETGLSAYDPQLRAPLAEMPLERFIAGYLKGRAISLDQEAARGPVPINRALPPARGSRRQALPNGAPRPRPALPPGPGSDQRGRVQPRSQPGQPREQPRNPPPNQARKPPPNQARNQPRSQPGNQPGNQFPDKGPGQSPGQGPDRGR